MDQLAIYKKRITQFIDRVKDGRYGDRAPLTASYIYHEDTPITYGDATSRSDYRDISIGDSWGSLWGCAWFQFTGTIPASMEGKEVVALIDVEGEGCVFQNGVPVQGLTTSNAMRVHETKRRVPIANVAEGDTAVELLVEAGANTLFGEGGKDPSYTLKQAELAVYSEDVWQLVLDLFFLFDLANNLPESSTRARQIYRGLNDAANVWNDGQGLAACREITHGLLAVPATASQATVWSVGHAHIDLGWLWPVRETRRKAGRTFSTALRLMERYPDYVFGASQPQLYQWTKQDYPELYSDIKARVADGRWECQGAMWVEPDMNLAGGEALVRQCLYGRAFYREEFGVEVDNLWLPDVFGYSAALPQILKKSGVEYFVTQKISWNETNVFPHHTFYWQGIDGTQILSHFLPTNNYNVVNIPSQLVKAEERFAQADVQPHFLNLYGVGDGGGGPSRTNIEFGMRAENTEGMPKFKFAPAKDFLAEIGKIEPARLPTWVGELYLELHRGTYTTQGRMKKYNRQLELTLRDVEFLSVLAESYPDEQLRSIWHDTLLNQFHDILPGSSIGWVYNDAHAMSQKNLDSLHSMQNGALAKLHGPASDSPKCLVLYNSLSWERREVVQIPREVIGTGAVVFSDPDGSVHAHVETDAAYLLDVTMPAMGYTAITVGRDTTSGKGLDPQKPSVATTKDGLENKFLKVEFADDGTISRIFDKELGCETLSGPANLFELWEDYPYSWDAWDVSHYYRETTPEHATLVSRSVCQDTPLRGSVTQSFTIGNSTIEQRVSLDIDSRVILCETTVDWKESHKFLKVAAETSVHSHEATYEIQFGQVKRPNHENTSWDQARFEVAAHRYADLSQPDRGFSLLNDSKYGYRVVGTRMELSLLRSPKQPDPDADMHSHTFTFAYYPHGGSVIDGKVLQAAHQLNSAPIIHPAASVPGEAQSSAFDVEGGTVKIEAVKQSEDGTATVVRLYEYAGMDARIEFVTGRAYDQAEETDLEERVIAACGSGRRVPLSFTPYEIKTIKLTG